MKKIGDKKKANKLAKVLSWLVVLAILICAMPCVAAALNEAGDDTKIVDREKRLALAESRSTAHLKNNIVIYGSINGSQGNGARVVTMNILVCIPTTQEEL
jgi:hypothetical protein